MDANHLQPSTIAKGDPAPGPHFHLGAGLPLDDPQSPLAPYFLRSSHVVAATLLAGLFLFLTLVPLWHTDIWGHLKFGRWMVQHRQLPASEPFSPFADQTAPTLHTYWLSQTVLYLVYLAGDVVAGGDESARMAGGVAMLHLAHALIVVARCAILIMAFRRLGCPWPLALLGLAVMLVMSVGHLAVFRPQVLGELFFACVLLCMSRIPMSRWSVLWLPALFVVWANSHGSFIFGLIVLGMFLVGMVFQGLWEARSWRPGKVLADPKIRRLAVVVAMATVAVAVLNPHGPWIFWNTIQMGRHPNVQDMDEWKSLFSSGSTEAVLIYALSLLLVVATPLVTRTPFTPGRLLLLLVFGLMPLIHVRMQIWWLILFPWLLLPSWSRVGHHWTFLKRFESVPNIRKTVMAGLIVTVALLWSTPGMWLLNGRPWMLEQAVSQATPIAAAGFAKGPASDESRQWLKAFPNLATYLNRDRFPGVVFASETLGDYFLWTGAPETKVFSYSHVHLLPEHHWKEILRIRSGAEGCRELMDGHRINMVVVEAEQHQRLRQLLIREADWQIVVDETGDRSKIDNRTRLLVALRKNPLESKED